MTSMAAVLSILSPERATGPIFTKELRVASRRRRNYWLRVGYIGLMLLFLLGVVGRYEYTDSPNQVYQQAQQGKSIVMVVAWVQFIALQLVATVLASSAINEEIYSRSLGVLMTTPITSLQIVLGKLLSKMLQILLLIVISLPVLAILRVYGGVPWGFLMASTSITLTACLFAAGVSMFYSVFIRRAWAVTLLSLATMFFLFVICLWLMSLAVALLFMAAGGGGSRGDWMLYFTAAVNPYAAMGFATAEIMLPGRSMSPLGWGYGWMIHCAIMLGLSAGLVAIIVPMVRRRALRAALGGGQAEATIARVPMPPLPPLPVLTPAGEVPSGAQGEAVSPPGGDSMPAASGRAATYWKAVEERSLRTVSDRPVLWRELKIPLIQSRGARIALLVIVLVILGLLYAGMFAAMVHGGGHLESKAINMPFVLLYMFCGLACAVVVSATPISSEREAGTLSLLMATPMSETSILWSKAAGVFRRIAPIWAFLLGHCLVFSILWTVSPILILHMLMLVVGSSAFVIGSGLYFSARFRKTTTAAVCNLALAIVLWALLPIFIGLYGSSDWEVLFNINPLYLAGMLTNGAAYPWVGDMTNSFYWAGLHNIDMIDTTMLVTAIAVSYALLGCLFMVFARKHLRRNLFA